MDNPQVQYLYFPRCKITKCDALLGNDMTNVILYIKSLEKTPSHYPKHYMLEGKADFLFKLQTDINWKIRYIDRFENLFSKRPEVLSPRSCLKKEISVLTAFCPDEDITLKCIAMGFPNEEPTIFNISDPRDICDGYSKIAVLNYKLNKIGPKKKINKI